MRYHVLASDYDGTLAWAGRVEAATIDALERLRASGRKLILVTGRELKELLPLFPQLPLFERVVAENGALLYRPATRETKLLSEAPSEKFLHQLRQRGVSPLSVGQVIVATHHPHENTILDVIRQLGLEMQVIFNKESVMVLPAGVNKASGLAAALKEIDSTAHEVVGVGDAENDHAFLTLCECAAAVANALPALKERADLVTRGSHGRGVVELIDELLANDLAGVEQQLTRHRLQVGSREDGAEVFLPPYGLSVLIAGPSGSGKSTVATSLLEQLEAHHYQLCIIDPEGDYDGLAVAVTLGSAQRGPTTEEVLQVLADGTKNVVVNLIGLPLTDRPPFFLALLPRLQEMRARTGRPHWLVVDEAHHLLPAAWEPTQLTLPGDWKRTLFLTVHPDQVSPAALAAVDVLLAVGQNPQETVGEVCRVLAEQPPTFSVREQPFQPGNIMLWPRYLAQAPYSVRSIPHRLERRRHVRKYAEGQLPPAESFFFTGPEGKLHLPAQNLILFLQLAEGVDDETWQYHLERGDYSAWFRTMIKDETLADEAAKVEGRIDLPPKESRTLIKAIVESYYTLPAAASFSVRGPNVAPTRP